MKEWPENNEIVPAHELLDPLCDVVIEGYTLRRKDKNKDIPYKGFNLGKHELSSCMRPDELFTAESLAYILENQGRTLIEEVICLAFQLGIEQGRRRILLQLENIVADPVEVTDILVGFYKNLWKKHIE